MSSLRLIWKRPSRARRAPTRSWPARSRACSRLRQSPSTRGRNWKLSCRSTWPGSQKETGPRENWLSAHTSCRWGLGADMLELILWNESKWNGYNQRIFPKQFEFIVVGETGTKIRYLDINSILKYTEYTEILLLSVESVILGKNCLTHSHVPTWRTLFFCSW